MLFVSWQEIQLIELSLYLALKFVMSFSNLKGVQKRYFLCLLEVLAKDISSV